MASPAAEQLPNGISTPPTTANAGNPSPPTAPFTQPNTQQASQSQTNGSFASAGPINPAFPPTSLQDSGATKRPRDARLIHLILANMGVHAYTERVPLQLLDFAYRYTNGILSDALAYEPPAPHHTGGKKKAAAGGAGDGDEAGGISLNALRTAVAARAANQFSAVLPKEVMTEVASERNRVALPRVEREWGIRLPPERYCFTGVGWGLKDTWEEETSGDELDLAIGGVVGGPVGGVAAGLPVNDTEMGGMGEEEEGEMDQFEDAFGTQDAEMTSG